MSDYKPWYTLFFLVCLNHKQQIELNMIIPLLHLRSESLKNF